ncbi:MAG TPA: alpha/beta hydrolase-fold protein [Bacteroidia bacterium]
MKKLFFLALFAPLLGWGQLTIKINYAFQLTPLTDTLYLSGNFNGWVANDANYKFQRTGFNVFEITINPSAGNLQYKVTRGSWATVETDGNGASIANRTYTYSGASATVSIQVNGWNDLGGVNVTTATQNVHILANNLFMPQLNRYRRIWVYLPPDYQTSSKNYPVLYMHDGQNLFDANFSAYGEWKVDESLDTLFTTGDYGIIVVGIENGGSNRINEYSPWIDTAYGGGQGAAYMQFVVNTLKPTIDGGFRTNTLPQYTGIMGSSMGGLISQYGAIAYQNTFKKVGLLSPSFWFSDSVFVQVHNTGVQNDMKFYFVAGTNESTTMVPLMQDMRDSVITYGLDSSRTKLRTYVGGQHSEAYWALEFPAAYLWLFSDVTNTTSSATLTKETKEFSIFPNPNRGLFNLTISQFDNGKTNNVEIYNTIGEYVHRQIATSANCQIDLSSLSEGVYNISSISNEGAVNKRLVIVK